MQVKIISKGVLRNGTKTAQVVILDNGKSQTKHLQYVLGAWRDASGTRYEL